MKRAPAIFFGHGSPMNAIENNTFSHRWAEIGREIARPSAILSVSAHWFTDGTRVSNVLTNHTIHDMYGFPEELYRVRYDAPGAPDIAAEALALLDGHAVADGTWGLDHGTWSVLRHLYPEADVPVFQVSVNAKAALSEHLTLGQRLAPLREKGVMILGSGNVVHHLGMVDWQTSGGFAWADSFDHAVREAVLAGAFPSLAQPNDLSPSARLAIPTPDHYAPLLAVLGAVAPEESVTVFNDARVYGSLSMTSYLFA